MSFCRHMLNYSFKFITCLCVGFNYTTTYNGASINIFLFSAYDVQIPGPLSMQLAMTSALDPTHISLDTY